MIRSVSIWAPFVLASAITMGIGQWGWALSSRWTLLQCCGLLSVFFGIVVVWRTRPKRWPIAAVALGLFVGQWWFVEMLIVFAFWKWRGFAP
jgi:uncharacterized membrane protein YqgA involved in biofilm formation